MNGTGRYRLLSYFKPYSLNFEKQQLFSNFSYPGTQLKSVTEKNKELEITQDRNSTIQVKSPLDQRG